MKFRRDRLIALAVAAACTAGLLTTVAVVGWATRASPPPPLCYVGSGDECASLQSMGLRETPLRNITNPWVPAAYRSSVELLACFDDCGTEGRPSRWAVSGDQQLFAYVSQPFPDAFLVNESQKRYCFLSYAPGGKEEYSAYYAITGDYDCDFAPFCPQTPEQPSLANFYSTYSSAVREAVSAAGGFDALCADED